MATLVLYPACPVCGQTLRSRDWRETVGVRPVSIAHEIDFARRSIERRELKLGETSSSEAVVVVGVDEKQKAIFESAGGREAPSDWPEQLDRAMIRSATKLGFEIRHERDVDAALDDMTDPRLTNEEFREATLAYLREAERALMDAQAELQFRQKEVQQAEQQRRR